MTLKQRLILQVVSLIAITNSNGTPAHVTIGNSSNRTNNCAEIDNVRIGFHHAGVTNFLVDVRHPSYYVAVDSTRPNWENCPLGTNDPSFTFQNPGTRKLFDNTITSIVAERFASFWRSNTVTIRVGSQVATGMHTLTLYRKIRDVASWPQCLVLYGADGWLRLKPHPPTNLADNVFGASILIGPVTHELRPIVNISEVEFVPATDSLRLTYRPVGSAELKIQEISRSRFAMSVSLNAPISQEQPFAYLNSMYVNRTNCDSEVVVARASPTNDWTIRPVLDFSQMFASEASFARISEPQSHNRSAPDIWFGNFEAAPTISAIFTNGIVFTRDAHLIMAPSGSVPGQEVILSGMPDFLSRATNCHNPSIQHGIIYFDGISGAEGWAKRRLFRYDVILNSLLKLSSDPFGNSSDWRMVTSAQHEHSIITSTRFGSTPWQSAWSSQSIGPGTGTPIGPDAAAAWTKQGPDFLRAYVANGSEIRTVSFASGRLEVIASNAWPESTLGTIERLDSPAEGDSLLTSTAQGIFLLDLHTSQITPVRSAGREANYHPADATRIVFSEAVSGETNRDIFIAELVERSGELSNVEQITFTAGDEREPCWFVLPPPSLRIVKEGYWTRIICPLWTFNDFDVQYSADAGLSAWQVSQAQKFKRTYTYELWLYPEQYGPNAFFRLTRR